VDSPYRGKLTYKAADSVLTNQATSGYSPAASGQMLFARP
jgi:hypothetical protein